MRKHEELLKKEFSKDGRVNARLVEVYEDCPDGKTRWIYYALTEGKFKEMRYDTGDDVPEATFISSGKYKDYVKVETGEISPKSAHMNGTFTLKGNMMQALSMIGIYNRIMKCKQFEDIEY